MNTTKLDGESPRARTLLRYLVEHPEGGTTRLLSTVIDSCAVHTDIANLRAHGIAIQTTNEGKNPATGNVVYRYSILPEDRPAAERIMLAAELTAQRKGFVLMRLHLEKALV